MKIQLTKKQIKDLTPLFDEAEREMRKGNIGVLLFQPMRDCWASHTEYLLNCGFIGNKNAVKIANIIKKEKKGKGW